MSLCFPVTGEVMCKKALTIAVDIDGTLRNLENHYSL